MNGALTRIGLGFVAAAISVIAVHQTIFSS